MDTSPPVATPAVRRILLTDAVQTCITSDDRTAQDVLIRETSGMSNAGQWRQDQNARVVMTAVSFWIQDEKRDEPTGEEDPANAQFIKNFESADPTSLHQCTSPRSLSHGQALAILTLHGWDPLVRLNWTVGTRGEYDYTDQLRSRARLELLTTCDCIVKQLARD